ncbi:META domain-containing protein [Sphingomonas sp. LT1P40]|uniref:META domain-containing protein n=1 Tax=Alteristakelama amylovorans TaxID=3096166 RepID=UPI002FC60EE1
MRLVPLLIAATAPLALAAPAEAQRPAPYRALGNEPGWTLTIDSRQMRYDGDYGNTRVNAPTPRVQPIRNGRRYVTRGLTVEITNRECSDGMSDRRYADTVRVIARGRTVNGCGGEVWELPELTGQRWRIQQIGSVYNEPRLGKGAVRFDTDRLSATPGCNSFSGAYRIQRGRLIAGPLAGTRKMCLPNLMRRDAEFGAIMRQPLKVTSPRPDVLLLTAPDGKQIMLRRQRGVR